MQLLLDLPPELQLLVVDQLPLREIPRLRQICKTMRTVVDSYAEALALARIRKSLKHFEDEVREISSYSEPTTLEECLRSLQFWYRKRGCYEDSVTNAHSLSIWFTHLYHSSSTLEEPGTHAGSRVERLRGYFRLATMLTGMRKQRVADLEAGEHKTWHDEPSDAARRYLQDEIVKGGLVMTHDQLGALMKRVNHPNFALWVSWKDARTPAVPVHAITTCHVNRAYVNIVTGEGRYGVHLGHVSGHDLGELLGLPALPPTNTFAYATKSGDDGSQKWAYNFLTKSVAWGTVCFPMRTW